MTSKINILIAISALAFFTYGFFVYDDVPDKRTGIAAGAQNPGIGSEAPEIELKNPSGKVMKLSSLRGKYVLLDFWASWCGPCRKENPNLVEAYKKYSKATFKDGKGFEIYSVSLDNKKDAWIKAIKSDDLSWKYHVSDLAGWKSVAAGTYRVNSIPMNFLISPDGIILASNLRGLDLHVALDAYVKKL